MNYFKYYIDDILPSLDRFIKQKQLTDCLNCLELLGYSGDAAITLLAYLQQREVEA
ncbi:hypothetical protein F7734_52800 [Scytonema sp. UIC 10036]|uniref:hypothetical protein n=1 Tax=Scytonema sp. UIC 10036 TaxID=2304196 RepID=UPI0012DAA039|nr:hypothetical protein [Scytonema sp. UIC 10036]MUH00495.1 hypothetical protein [Scytonema sp. UIC 10036]